MGKVLIKGKKEAVNSFSKHKGPLIIVRNGITCFLTKYEKRLQMECSMLPLTDERSPLGTDDLLVNGFSSTSC